MSEKYILDGHNPRRVDDVIEWAKWYENADRRVALTEIAEGVKVSTVFLGLNHSWNGGLEIFETMVFGGPMDEWGDRYATWDQAVEGHEKTVGKVLMAIEEARVKTYSGD